MLTCYNCIMKKREQIEVMSRYESRTLDEMVALLTDAKNQVPADYQDSVRFDIDMTGYPYDSNEYPKLFMTYERSETELEKKIREGEEAALERIRMSRDRAEYERLSALFKDL